MVTQTCPLKLASLIDYLDGLTQRVDLDLLETQLRSLDLTVTDVDQYARFSPKHYVRNLIRSSDWYHLLVLCWRSGQRSPIHNHAKSACGFKILSGVATETQFEITPCSLIKPVASQDMRVGDVAVTMDANIHQVSNLCAPGDDLVTLHIYSPPLLRMDTYSLTDPTIGQFTPMILEHVHGSGI